MRRFAWLLVFLGNFSLLLPTRGDVCPAGGRKGGYFSKKAVSLCFQDVDKGIRHLEIPSPNQSVVLAVDGNQGRFLVNGRTVAGPIAVAPDEEVIWSPDSKAVIFTIILGGLGPVSAGISFVNPTAPSVPAITEALQEDYSARHPGQPCSHDVNVAGLAWMNDSSQAVFITEIPSSSSCGQGMGNFESYVVSIPAGKIQERLDEQDTIKRWRNILSPDLLGN
jgi:hypothetical protein